ncbi:hypothetical protein [Clostridium lundense]|nr:hypothetical protein [Clostridium lundense]
MSKLVACIIALVSMASLAGCKSSEKNNLNITNKEETVVVQKNEIN